MHTVKVKDIMTNYMEVRTLSNFLYSIQITETGWFSFPSVKPYPQETSRAILPQQSALASQAFCNKSPWQIS